MLHKPNQETPVIALQSNWLTVNGRTLRADVLKNPSSESLTTSAEELTKYLTLGRCAILQQIEYFYQQQIQNYPDLTISRPSVFVAHLGTTAQTEGINSKVFTKSGYKNGGVNLQIDEIKPYFHDYWAAVLNAGFTPEVRRTSGGRQVAGSWLLLRTPGVPK